MDQVHLWQLNAIHADSARTLVSTATHIEDAFFHMRLDSNIGADRRPQPADRLKFQIPNPKSQTNSKSQIPNSKPDLEPEPWNLESEQSELDFVQLEADGVETVALPGRLRSIGEYVTQVSVTLAAQHFGSAHVETVIHFRTHTLV